MEIINTIGSLKEQKDIIVLCLDFLSRNGGSNIAMGKYTVQNGIYLNVSEYITSPSIKDKWEAHKKYVDFQIVLEGNEIVYVSNIDKMKVGEYDAEEDYIPCFGESEVACVIDNKTGVILMPNDAHMPGISADGIPMIVKKAVFKIPVALWL